MLIGAHTIAVTLKSEVGGEEIEELVKVVYWVGREGSTDVVAIDDEDCGAAWAWAPDIALQVAKAVTSMVAWSKSKAGAKEIERLRKLVIKKEGAE